MKNRILVPGLMSRRRMLALTSGTMIAACSGGGGGGSSSPPPVSPAPPPPPPSPPPPPDVRAIRLAAEEKNMRFGTALNTGSTFGDNNYLSLMTENCNSVVAENDHKWGALRPTPDTFSFGNGDNMVSYANGEGLDFRFHTMMWERDDVYPNWFQTYDFGADPAAEAERMIKDHIRTVARHPNYAADMHSWDVVNEAVDNTTGEYRSTYFSRALGSMEAVLDIAFTTAREELPTSQLVYNDFMSWNGTGDHHTGVLRLLEGLLTRGTSIDALGIQGHVWAGNSGGYSANEAEWTAFLDEVIGMGLGLVITEFDMNDSDLPANIESRDERVAEVTKAYLDLMFSYPQIDSLTCWGLVHRYSWLQDFAARSDGEQLRCTPFDDDYEPTLMAQAIVEAFEGTTAR